MIEKPFGRDLASARALNRDISKVLDESQVYRIDHYLGKETVQNILALRFGNAIFEPIWDRRHVAAVQITAAEELGMAGGRGGYYDNSGALRDMVQNHLMQLLCLVAMEPPVDLSADAVRNERAKVLDALPRWTADDVARNVVRGQYTAGSIEGKEVPGYLQEKGVRPDSKTETYIALRVTLNNWRWAGVPFYLRTGKRLPKRASEIAILFHKPPTTLFEVDTEETGGTNLLVLRIQPNEGASLAFQAKVPASRRRLQEVRMDFRYGTAFAVPPPEAYERLLLDVMLGDPTLYTRTDAVESAWRFCTAILDAWASHDAPPLLPVHRRNLGARRGRLPDERRVPLAEALIHVREPHDHRRLPQRRGGPGRPPRHRDRADPALGPRRRTRREPRTRAAHRHPDRAGEPRRLRPVRRSRAAPRRARHRDHAVPLPDDRRAAGAIEPGRNVAAEVSALCHLPAPGLPQVCSERIVLRAGPQAGDLLPGAIRPLLEADLPFVLWWTDDPRSDEAPLPRPGRRVLAADPRPARPRRRSRGDPARTRPDRQPL